jgi:hypothetical protein
MMAPMRRRELIALVPLAVRAEPKDVFLLEVHELV